MSLNPSWRAIAYGMIHRFDAWAMVVKPRLTKLVVPTLVVLSHGARLVADISLGPLMPINDKMNIPLVRVS